MRITEGDSCRNDFACTFWQTNINHTLTVTALFWIRAQFCGFCQTIISNANQNRLVIVIYNRHRDNSIYLIS